MSPAYFFDKMTFAEIEEYIDGLDARRREEWERTRSVVHAVFQSRITHPIAPLDVMTLPWDEPRTTAIEDSEEARVALAERAKAMERNFKQEQNNG